MNLFAEPRSPAFADCYFYHTIDLPGVGVVKGEWDLRDTFDDYLGRVPLAGKTVLDVGTASGFLTFEAEKRGASVVSFDLADASTQQLLPFRDKLDFTDRPAWVAKQTAVFERWKNGYWFAHQALGSKARCHYGSIYDLPPALGTFDVVVMGSVLEHLADPISAMASCARLCSDTLILATPAVMTEDRMAEFRGRASRPDDDYTWWTYSVGTYKEVLAMLGFTLDRIVTTNLKFEWVDHPVERPTLVARRVKPGIDAIATGFTLAAPAPTEPPAVPVPPRTIGRKLRSLAKRAVGR
ncbi:MAG: class I SAM-dependent methyltransferase [Fimbriiglobus sp.]